MRFAALRFAAPLAMAIAVLASAGSPVKAAPTAMPAGIAITSDVVEVSGGCGPGGHRNPWGYCRPNYRGGGWGYGWRGRGYGWHRPYWRRW